MLKVKNISAQDTYEIRLNILRKNIDLPYKFIGDNDSTTFHLGVFNNEMLVGIASFMKVSCSSDTTAQYQLRGMATTPEVRGKGAGKKIIEEAKQQLKQIKIESLWCNARKEAVDFYKKLGFKIISDEFNVPKVGPHFKMEVKL